VGQHDKDGPTTQMPEGLVMKASDEHAAHMIKFACLGDSSPDTHGPSPPEKAATKDVLMCSIATPG
jgi:hypothetical protein